MLMKTEILTNHNQLRIEGINKYGERNLRRLCSKMSWSLRKLTHMHEATRPTLPTTCKHQLRTAHKDWHPAHADNLNNLEPEAGASRFKAHLGYKGKKMLKLRKWRGRYFSESKIKLRKKQKWTIEYPSNKQEIALNNTSD